MIQKQTPTEELEAKIKQEAEKYAHHKLKDMPYHSMNVMVRNAYIAAASKYSPSQKGEEGENWEAKYWKLNERLQTVNTELKWQLNDAKVLNEKLTERSASGPAVTFKFNVDNKTIETEHRYLTGCDIKEMAKAPKSYGLWLKSSTDEPDREIADGEHVDLNQPNRNNYFTGSKTSTQGAVIEEELQWEAAESIVADLAAWSERYPPNQSYSMGHISHTEMYALEKRAKEYISGRKASGSQGAEYKTMTEKRGQALEKIEEMKKVLLGYEDWEAELIGDNRCWEPEGMASLPRLTNELYDKMLELQAKRNEVLRSLKLPSPPSGHKETQ